MIERFGYCDRAPKSWLGFVTDTLTINERSERMSRVRGKDTKPEILVRRLVHGMGFRYRLHAKELPSRPDIVFRRRKKAIFVHGCFWHRHPGCKMTRMPKTRLEFWKPKLEGNRKRDLRNQKTLEDMGWKYMVVWECQIQNTTALALRVKSFLSEEGINQAP